MPGEKRRLKIVVVGAGGAGKTSFVTRGVHKMFSKHYVATDKVSFALLNCPGANNQPVTQLQMWDIAGAELHATSLSDLMKEASAVVMVLSTSDTGLTLISEELLSNQRIQKEIESLMAESAPVFLVVNKMDLCRDEDDMKAQLQAAIDGSWLNGRVGSSQVYYCSAKTGAGVADVFDAVRHQLEAQPAADVSASAAGGVQQSGETKTTAGGGCFSFFSRLCGGGEQVDGREALLGAGAGEPSPP